MMSSAPEEHPIEAGIVPLVYAFHNLRLIPPCWSCEGHYNKAGELGKLPRVWFYARSLAYPNLIAESISEPRIAKQLSQPWQVCLVRWNDAVDVTFSIEPRIKPRDEPRLERLRDDVKIIARALESGLKRISRHWIAQL
jgi:hypothetical protein